MNLFFLYLTVFITFFGFSMVFPLLPYYALEFNATPAQVGFLAASHALANFFTSPVLGRLSDKVGRRPVLIGGLLAGAASLSLMGFANSLLMLLLSRIAHGVVAAAIMPTARAYIGDTSPPSERIAAMGKIGAAHAAGLLFGPALSSFLVGIGGISLPFFAAGAVSLFNAISVTFVLAESLKRKNKKLAIKGGFLDFLKMPKILRSELGLLFLILFAWSFTMSQKQVSFPLFGKDQFNIGASEIGYFFTATAVISILMQGFLLPRIVRVLGEKTTIFTGLVVMGGSTLVLPFMRTFWVMLLFYLLWGVGSSLNRPTAEGVISRITKIGQGTTMGLAHSFESLGRVLGPLLGGVLFGEDPAAPFVVSALMVIVLAFASLFLLSIPKLRPADIRRTALVEG